MNRFTKTTFALMLGLFVILGGCEHEEQHSVKRVQEQRAQEAANSLTFTENAEIDNIKKRLQLTSKPDLLGYVLLMNEMGQPVMYTSVKGKITASGKRLTPPDRLFNNGNGTSIRAGGSDEGTYGSSGEYVFFWTMDGQYIQWNGKYLYSNEPFRLKIEPLVTKVEK